MCHILRLLPRVESSLDIALVSRLQVSVNLLHESETHALRNGQLLFHCYPVFLTIPRDESSVQHSTAHTPHHPNTPCFTDNQTFAATKTKGQFPVLIGFLRMDPFLHNTLQLRLYMFQNH